MSLAILMTVSALCGFALAMGLFYRPNRPVELVPYHYSPSTEVIQLKEQRDGYQLMLLTIAELLHHPVTANIQQIQDLIRPVFNETLRDVRVDHAQMQLRFPNKPLIPKSDASFSRT
jgi:hypothetical protein